jgi:AraC-like DNA-binding protein
LFLFYRILTKTMGQTLELPCFFSTLHHPLDSEHGDIVRSGRRVHKIENLLPDLFKELSCRGHRLRLSEAQRLMTSDNFDVAQAAFSVGYESATQFNREYKRLFGESPRKDVLRMKFAM